jgi:hypothetical protein
MLMESISIGCQFSPLYADVADAGSQISMPPHVATSTSSTSTETSTSTATATATATACTETDDPMAHAASQTDATSGEQQVDWLRLMSDGYTQTSHQHDALERSTCDAGTSFSFL